MIAVDTNIVSALLRGEPCVLPAEELYIPFMVLAELSAGIDAGNNPAKNHKLLQKFLHDPNLTASPGLTPDVIACYAQIYSYLRRQGRPISANDLWIAAECMQLAMPLLTRDKDFKQVPQIILVTNA